MPYILKPEDKNVSKAENYVLQELRKDNWVCRILPGSPAYHEGALVEDAKRHLTFHGSSFRTQEDQQLKAFVKEKLGLAEGEAGDQKYDLLYKNYNQALEGSVHQGLAAGLNEGLFVESDRSGNLYTKNDEIYFEGTIESIKFGEPSFDEGKEKQALPGSVKGTFILTEEGFKLISIVTSNRLLAKIYLSDKNQNPTAYDIREANKEELQNEIAKLKRELINYEGYQDDLILSGKNVLKKIERLMNKPSADLVKLKEVVKLTTQIVTHPENRTYLNNFLKLKREFKGNTKLSGLVNAMANLGYAAHPDNLFESWWHFFQELDIKLISKPLEGNEQVDPAILKIAERMQLWRTRIIQDIPENERFDVLVEAFKQLEPIELREVEKLSQLANYLEDRIQDPYSIFVSALLQAKAEKHGQKNNLSLQEVEALSTQFIEDPNYRKSLIDQQDEFVVKQKRSARWGIGSTSGVGIGATVIGVIFLPILPVSIPALIVAAISFTFTGVFGWLALKDNNPKSHIVKNERASSSLMANKNENSTDLKQEEQLLLDKTSRLEAQQPSMDTTQMIKNLGGRATQARTSVVGAVVNYSIDERKTAPQAVEEEDLTKNPLSLPKGHEEEITFSPTLGVGKRLV